SLSEQWNMSCICLPLSSSFVCLAEITTQRWCSALLCEAVVKSVSLLPYDKCAFNAFAQGNLVPMSMNFTSFNKSLNFPPFFPPQAVCDHDRACGRGFSCDRHFGLCVPLRGEGHYCRRDAQCVRGLSCMFGKCHRSIPNGQEGKGAPSVSFVGARCKVDRDCGTSMCCARHHGEQVCKRRLISGESCYVPDGGLAFSINQICPCDEGLLCRKDDASHQRE
uniref:Dickkopf N-terminal cysteine-rich domain-containing protein n=1 Tax=Sander lucioperca TaxID=283035 RepID=A0A8D0ACD3_SANLU